jgi:hypothetical protein
MNKDERLLMQLQREADIRFQREVDNERQEVIRQNISPESKSDQCRRKLRELRAKTNAIEHELDLRHRVELESQRHLKATMALREANLTVAEKQARAEETRRGQILFSRIVPENHPDWREQENPNLAFYRQQIAPVKNANAKAR